MFKNQIKTAFINVIMFAVTQLLDAAFIGFLKAAVQEQMDTDISGDAKRERVMAELTNARGHIASVFAVASNSLINLAIEAVVAWAKHELAKRG